MKRRERQGLRQHEEAQILVGRKTPRHPPPPFRPYAPVSPAGAFHLQRLTRECELSRSAVSVAPLVAQGLSRRSPRRLVDSDGSVVFIEDPEDVGIVELLFLAPRIFRIKTANMTIERVTFSRLPFPVELLGLFEIRVAPPQRASDQPDLVLDPTLLPARCRRARDWIDQVMAAHLQEAAIVEAVLADEDRLHRGLHVVVDAASAGPLEQSKGPVVGIEHHLLRLAWISAHEQHAAVTKPGMGNPHDHRHAAQQDNFVAPVELVGFSRGKAQRDIGCSRRLTMLLSSSPA
jgi:hypothetical protein